MGNYLGIVGVGVDVVELADIRKARFTKRFAEYFLTEEEMTCVPKGLKKIEFLASRFAAKEAVIKAFPGKLRPHDFIVGKRDERPFVSFSSKKNELLYTVHISLSHTIHVAVATAIVLARKG